MPYITSMKPQYDLCDICRLNVAKIQPEDLTYEMAVTNAKEHLDRAKKQREYYNSWRSIVKSESEATLLGISGNCEVLSFNFAQQVQFPSHPQQVSPTYFKMARKCGIFGVHNERTHVQMNYLIDERVTMFLKDVTA